jgi:hypothetical protein
MAEPYRRPGKKYLGIDFPVEDYEKLHRIALEDGSRGVSSLVRSIVHSWLRKREASDQPTIVSLPPSRPTSRSFDATQISKPPSAPVSPMWIPENPNLEEPPQSTEAEEENE